MNGANRTPDVPPPGSAQMNGGPELVGTSRLDVRRGSRLLAGSISVSVRSGETWAMLGPNGVGKSTLLAILSGALPPGSGSVRVGGRAIGAWAPGELARFRGYLPQFVHDAFGASVLDTVMLGRHPFHSRWHWEDDSDAQGARAALAAVDLADAAQRDVTTLSGGERQRAAIATILVQDPELLLLDEPVAHLDLHYQHRVLSLLRRIAIERGKAVVFSVHDPNLAARHASHALLFAGAAGIVHGPIDTVLTEANLSTAFRHRIVRGEVAGSPHFAAL